MTSFQTEKASEFFFRLERDSSHIALERNTLPSLSHEDIVQICGGPGSGKTEFLYHLITRCILPDIGCKGLHLKGLSIKVILIDNELRFDLFRLVNILERRIRSFGIISQISLSAKEISSFIDERLELLEIIKCVDFDEFVGSLRYFELLQCQKYILMIDGINSFYWSNKMRSSCSPSPLTEPNALVPSMLKNVSKNCGVPVILTYRKLSQSSVYDQQKHSWRKIITKLFELTYSCSKENVTSLSISDAMSGRRWQCAIASSGFRFL